MAEDKSKISSNDTSAFKNSDRPTVRGTSVGGQYISPRELFTTKAGRQAIRNLIKVAEQEKSKSNHQDRA